MPPYAQNLTTFFALFTIILGLIIIAVLFYRFIKGVWLPSPFLSLFDKYGIYILPILPLLAIPLSLWYSEVLHFEPCVLCWFGRVMMYPLALILLIAAIKKDKGVWIYALPLSVLGLAFSTYHHLIQVGVVGGGFCEAMGSDCLKRYVFEFGFVTMPFFGMIIFSFTILLLIIHSRNRNLL